MAEPIIQVQDVRHAFDGREVLKGISLDITPGEILVIMGSSGGGKTTLLKIIAGLIRPTSGEVLINGISMTKQPDKARKSLGMVFQYAALFDFLTVRDNILFGIKRMRKLSHPARQEVVEERLEEVGLKEIEHLLPSELSGGMRKRVGLARALATEPKVLLYDEPTSGLDPVTAYSIDRLIVETAQRHEMTSVVVSHDVTSVLRTADRVAFLHQGELLFLDKTEAFRRAEALPIRDLLDKAQADSMTA